MMADKKNNKNRRNLNKDYDDDFKVRKIFMYKKYSLDNNFRGKAGDM